ncbi:peptidoglycan DD-metalloendopeptidase family protein [Specibacter sp. NPDC078692]|uniref:M23 family metallopeptidase n=1 Tax=Specibacter sp. NPDC078692 TaxID=3155818 RepID=UPI00342D940D
MPSHRQHGRRRAQMSVPAPRHTGRHWSLPPATVPKRGRLGRKMGAIAASGFIMVATLTAAHAGVAHNPDTLDSTAPLAIEKNQPQVTANKDVALSFAAPAISSKPAPSKAPAQAQSIPAQAQSSEVQPASPAPATTAPETPSTTLRPPLASMTVNSPFGFRSNPLSGASGELHTGLDLAATCNTEVFAAGTGTVTEAGWSPYGGGNRIVIDHGNGIQTTYNHLANIGLSVGQQVTQGALVAGAGTTGNSTGCHLHFEVMVNGQTVDPDPFV